MPNTPESNALKNFFNTPMREGTVKAIEIATEMDDALFHLNADPDIVPLYALYHPEFELYIGEASTKTGRFQGRVAATGQVEVTIDDMSNEVNLPLWFIMIKTAKGLGTPATNALIGDGTYAFYHGNRASRLNRINALIGACGVDVTLAPVKALMQTYYNTATGTRSIQTSKDVDLGSARTTLETNLVNIIDAQWYVYGGLVMKYYKTPANIGNIIPFELLRQHANHGYHQFPMNPMHFREAFLHTFKPTDTIQITVAGAPLEFGMRGDSMAPATHPFTVVDGTPYVGSPSVLGDLTLRHGMVNNPSHLLPSHYIINIVAH